MARYPTSLGQANLLRTERHLTKKSQLQQHKKATGYSTLQIKIILKHYDSKILALVAQLSSRESAIFSLNVRVFTLN